MGVIRRSRRKRSVLWNQSGQGRANVRAMNARGENEERGMVLTTENGEGFDKH